MAQRRMFSLEVVDTDLFLDLPASSQSLYFHLGMRADDDGFVSNPRKITAMVNCSLDDLRLLMSKQFVIPFDSGVCVIRDWKTNNYIQKDRYRPTRYVEEKKRLISAETGIYTLLDTPCIQNVSNLDTEVRLELSKDRKGKSDIGADKPPRTRSQFVPPTLEEVTLYVKERGSKVDPQGFIDFYAAKGWQIGKNTMKDWKAACRNAENWERWDKKLDSRNAVKTAADYDD